MTGSCTPRKAEPGSQAFHRHSRIAGLEAIIRQRWDEIAQRPDPRMHAASVTAAGEAAPPPSLAARLQILAPVDSGLSNFLDQLETALRSQVSPHGAFDGDGDLDADTPLGLAPIGAPQACMQALVHDFSRRQRQATMLVAGCVAASCALTLAGIAALASIAGSNTGANEDASERHASSLAWQSPAPSNAVPMLASASPNRSRKSDALFVPAHRAAAEPSRRVTPREPHSFAPELVLMQAGRPLSLGPLIEQRQARYVLIRGLPGEAKLSAGQRNPSGAWLIKDEDIGALTLSIDGDASGDYTAEIYALGPSAPPQGRQRLVFRVEQAFGRAAALDANWTSMLPDMANERASLTGNEDARERLKILASLSD
jgi:hypothetical protein